METESAYPQPPEYYKDFKTPGFHLDPPKPIEGEYWNNGVIRNINTPILDHVNRVYPLLYDPRSLDATDDTKAEIAKKLLRKLIKAYIELIRKSETVSQDAIQPHIQELENISMNIVRLLNTMREYQFRENVIRSLRNQIEEKEKRLQELDTKISESKELMKECINAINTNQSLTAESVPSDNVENDTSSGITTTLINDLQNLLDRKYRRTQAEKENEGNEKKEQESERKESECVSLESDFFPSNTENGFATASFDMKSDGLQLLFVS